MPDDLDNPTPDDSPVIKELREKAKRADEAEQRAAAAEQRAAEIERQSAFRDQGLDPKNKLHLMAINGYDGDLSESAISQYVTELGLTAAAAPPPAAIPQAEQEAFGQIAAQQAGGAVPPAAPSSDQEMQAFWASLPDGIDKGQALSQWLEQRHEPVSWAGPQSDALPWGSPGLR